MQNGKTSYEFEWVIGLTRDQMREIEVAEAKAEGDFWRMLSQERVGLEVSKAEHNAIVKRLDDVLELRCRKLSYTNIKDWYR